jgi:FtsH-binding integral membrane protein
MNMDNFSENILKVIEKKEVIPKPRWHFLLKRWIFWLLAVFSILIGAIAFAVAEYVFFDNDGANVASLQDIAQNIPYVWFLVLIIFTISSYIWFRQTRKGYKYKTVVVVCGTVVISIILGLILNAFDFGQVAHKYLLSHTDFYDMLVHSSEDTQD